MFYLFSGAVRKGFMKQADFDTTVKIQGRLTHEGRVDTDTVMEGMTFFVSPAVSVAWVLVLFGAAAYDIRRKRIRWTAIAIPVLFGAMILGELYGKSVVHHPSPPFFMIRNPTTIFPKYYVNEQYSYPSGHAARAVFLSVTTASLLWQLTRRTSVRVLSVAASVGFVLLVGISRIYLGHHWLTDIVGGSLLGAGCVSLWLGLL